jgi:hypothetical protein
MYTQSFNVPDAADDPKTSTLKAVARPPSEAEIALQARFDTRVDADEKIEPKDWMPDAYRKDAGSADQPARPTAKSSACCPRATGSAAHPA